MRLYLGERAYDAYQTRLREYNLICRPWADLAQPHKEAWQAVGEAVARECGVDPAVFRRASGK